MAAVSVMQTKFGDKSGLNNVSLDCFDIKTSHFVGYDALNSLCVVSQPNNRDRVDYS